MQNNQGYKNQALQDLEGKWGTTAITTLVYLIITGGVSYVFTAPMGDNLSLSFSTQGLWTLLCLPLGWGFAVYFLNLVRQQDIRLERLFDGYKDFLRVFLAAFLVNLAVSIGFVLLIVPGIILAMMFSQTSFILKDDKEIGAVDALKKSAAMMSGHKAQYFWLLLSFIGWGILCLFTLGIGFLFLMPYMATTMAHYYEDLKAEQNAV